MAGVVVDGEPAERRSPGVELMEEDKQQLSPVSVMDFPFDHDDGDDDDDGDGEDEEEERSCDAAGACSPSFRRRIAELEGSETQQRRKARRVAGDGLAQAVGAVDLGARFQASCSGSDEAAAAPRRPDEQTDLGREERRPEEEEERRLLARLLRDHTAADEERLLRDFFAEELGRLRAVAAGAVVSTARHRRDHEEAAALALARAASEWVQGGGPRWGLGDVLSAGGAALADMERRRRWMRVGEEERDVGAAVEALVTDALLAELARDLATLVCTDVHVSLV